MTEQQQKLPIKPPSTANIPKPRTPSEKSSRNHKPLFNWSNEHRMSILNSPQDTAKLDAPGIPEFAPNAYPATSENDLILTNLPGKRWLDRVFDVLLGEDETLPVNRIVLICQSCRLVNGQAPPGVNSLASLGIWKCIGCHSINGKEVETKMALNKKINVVKDSKADLGMEISEVENRSCRTEAIDPENNITSDSVKIQTKKNRQNT